MGTWKLLMGVDYLLVHRKRGDTRLPRAHLSKFRDTCFLVPEVVLRTVRDTRVSPAHAHIG